MISKCCLDRDCGKTWPKQNNLLSYLWSVWSKLFPQWSVCLGENMSPVTLVGKLSIEYFLLCTVLTAFSVVSTKATETVSSTLQINTVHSTCTITIQHNSSRIKGLCHGLVCFDFLFLRTRLVPCFIPLPIEVWASRDLNSTGSLRSNLKGVCHWIFRVLFWHVRGVSRWFPERLRIWRCDWLGGCMNKILIVRLRFWESFVSAPPASDQLIGRSGPASRAALSAPPTLRHVAAPRLRCYALQSRKKL